MTGRPYILLAFSFDPQHALPQVAQELTVINKSFVKSCSAPLQYWSVSQSEIETAFETYRQDIRVFHFSGHAGSHELQTNFMGKPRYTFAEGLSKNIGLFGKGLKLVFLNGCSTKDQVDFFLKNGVPAVIATRKPVEDCYACDFARRFYEKFTSGNLSLYEAFEAAKNSFDAEGGHGNFCDRVKRIIQPKFLVERFRSSFCLENDDTPEIYDLHTTTENDPVRQETFTDWFPATSEDYTTEKESDPAKLNSGKKEELGYLKCDRDNSKDIFHKAVLEKINSQNPAPSFFIIHESEQHCPQLLPDRFERYSLRELYKSGQSPLDPDKSSNYFKELPLPALDKFEFDASGLTFSDRFKIELSQIYYDRFGGKPPGDNCLALLNAYKEPLLVVRHRLQHSQWRSLEAQAKLEALLKFYISAYSTDLQHQLTERLIVVFYMQLIKKDPFLQNDLFPKLEHDYSDKVKILTGLPEINWDHVQTWERDFLGVTDNTFIKTSKFFTVANETSGQLEPDPRDSLPFQDVIEKLKSEIRRYNNTLSYAA